MISPASNADLTGAIWHKSSYSNNGGNCVEVAHNLPGVVAVRDSKNRSAGMLTVTPDAWRALVGSIQDGEFSL